MRIFLPLLLAFPFSHAHAQDAAKRSDQNPPVKVNVLNVCTPDADGQQQLKAALARLPKSPRFILDYEIARGVATIQEGERAKYVRLRREFKSDSPLETVLYSLSSDPASTIETLVFRGRDVKDLLALSIEDKLSTAVSKPSTVVQSDTPASRFRLERAGKTTVGLARCEGVDQSQYEPLFAQASAVLADYRRVLNLRTTLANDIAWLGSTGVESESPTRRVRPKSSKPSGTAEAKPR